MSTVDHSDPSEPNSDCEGSEVEEEGEVDHRSVVMVMLPWMDTDEQDQLLQEEPGSWSPAPAPDDLMDDDKDDDEDEDDEDEEMDDDDDDDDQQ